MSSQPGDEADLRRVAVIGESIDWAALAVEMDREEHPSQSQTKSGIILPVFGSYQPRAWVKFTGEPAQQYVESPATFAARFMAFRDNPEQEVCVFHEFAYGQAIFLFREALSQLCYVQVTYPSFQSSQKRPGSIFSGDCICARFGGPCPPL